MSQRDLSAAKLKEIHDLAAGWGKIIARRVFGESGPDTTVDFQAMEQVASAAARGLTEGTLTTLVEQQAQTLGTEQPCPDCGCLCPVGYKDRPPGRQGRPTHPPRTDWPLSRLPPGLFPPYGPPCAWTTTPTAPLRCT